MQIYGLISSLKTYYPTLHLTPWSLDLFIRVPFQLPVADPECARGGGISHILAEKRGVSFTLLKKMHKNLIFSPITGVGGIRRVRPMLDPPLTPLRAYSPAAVSAH